MPGFAHLPLLIAPDGAKLSKRKHGPVVSVTTYRDAGFLPHAFVNFLCLLGWNPKDDREQMPRQDLIDAFTLEGINRANAVVNFKEDDPFDPKAVWLNSQHIYALPVPELSERLLPFVRAAGYDAGPAKMLAVTPLIQERIKLLRDVVAAADFFFVEELPPYRPRGADSAEGRYGHGAHCTAPGRGGAGGSRIHTRRSGERAARGCGGAQHQGRPDVPADPGGRLRTQERAAAVRDAGSARA